MKDGKWTEATVDLAAEESVCPKGWAEHSYELNPVTQDKRLNLVSANEGSISHYGSRNVVVGAHSVFPRPGQ